jgi:hypothetical protein
VVPDELFPVEKASDRLDSHELDLGSALLAGGISTPSISEQTLFRSLGAEASSICTSISTLPCDLRGEKSYDSVLTTSTGSCVFEASGEDMMNVYKESSSVTENSGDSAINRQIYKLG